MSLGLVPYWLPRFRMQKTGFLKLNIFSVASSSQISNRSLNSCRKFTLRPEKLQKLEHKENDLLVQIEKLKLEKQQTLQKNEFLKFEKATSMKEQEEEMKQLHAKLGSRQGVIEELELKLLQNSKEVDEGMELQNKLLLLIKSKASVIINKGKQLKEHEKNINLLLVKLINLERKVDELHEELRVKTEEVNMAKESNEKLFKKLESQATEIMNTITEQLLNNKAKEKNKLTAEVQSMEENAHELQKELWTKTEEIEEGKRQLSFEKNMLLPKVNDLEEKIIKLQAELTSRNNEVREKSYLHGNLVQEIEKKTSELLASRKKCKNLTDAYKRLKSQYTFMFSKFGLTRENMLSESKIEDESDPLKRRQNQITSSDIEDKSKYASIAACDTKKMKIERNISKNLEDEKGGKMVQGLNSMSPISISSVVSKPHLVAGIKRPAFSWRATRSHQGQGGPNPHYDFLFTPFENVKDNLNEAVKEEVSNLPLPEIKDKISDSSDDETQDLTTDLRPETYQMPDTVTGRKCFKFMEPVRKKAERENLKGI